LEEKTCSEQSILSGFGQSGFL